MRPIRLHVIMKILSVVLLLFVGFIAVKAQSAMRLQSPEENRKVLTSTHFNDDGTVSRYSYIHPACNCALDTLEVELTDGTFEMLFAIRNRNTIQKDTVETLIAGRKNLPVDVYENLEEMPKYKNGKDDLEEYIKSKIKFATNKTAVYIGLRFIVMANGKIQNVTFDYSRYYKLPEMQEKEIELIFKNMPAWKPGRLEGKAVNTYYYFNMQIVI